LVLLSAAAAIGFLIWAFGAAKGIAPRAGAAALAALLVAGVAYVSSPRSLALTPEAWSPQRVAELTAAGTPVFVNFTADWCVTCKVNERTALASESLAAAFAAKGVVYLKADWTARDDVIAQTLKSYGRTGVPLYLAYQSGAAEPQILPQVLTEAGVIAAFSDR
jgi:thiol:disulfide interchange protein DsbD